MHGVARKAKNDSTFEVVAAEYTCHMQRATSELTLRHMVHITLETG